VVRLKAQAAPFRPVYHLGEQVQALEAAERRLLGRSPPPRARSCRPRRVIVAAGVGAFGPNRPPLAGIEAYEGKSVFITSRIAKVSAANAW